MLKKLEYPIDNMLTQTHALCLSLSLYLPLGLSMTVTRDYEHCSNVHYWLWMLQNWNQLFQDQPPINENFQTYPISLRS